MSEPLTAEHEAILRSNLEHMPAWRVKSAQTFVKSATVYIALIHPPAVGADARDMTAVAMSIDGWPAVARDLLATLDASRAQVAEYERACERAAQIIGSEFRNPGVIEAALDWQEQRITERDAQVAALREALDWMVHLAYGVGKSGRLPEPDEFQDAAKAGKAALAQSPADALDALKREVFKRGAAWQRDHTEFYPDAGTSIASHPTDDEVDAALLAEARHE